MKSRKGVELPVNALVIILLAVIVLAAVIAIFTGVWTPGKKSTENIGNFNSICAQYAASNCCSADAARRGPNCNALREGALLTAARELGVTTSAEADQLCCRPAPGSGTGSDSSPAPGGTSCGAPGTPPCPS